MLLILHCALECDFDYEARINRYYSHLEGNQAMPHYSRPVRLPARLYKPLAFCSKEAWPSGKFTKCSQFKL